MPRTLHTATRVHKASTADVPALSHALADAFLDDPVTEWFLPRAECRMRRLERWFSLSLRSMALPHDETYTFPGLAGAALWIPPGKWEISALQSLRLMPTMAYAMGRDLPRSLRGGAAMEAKHPHEPHWYLPYVGVSPSHQGRGLGSALVEPILERCDRDGVPAYLEASSERSRDLYLRHGFEVTEEFHLPDDGPPVWRMWRSPS